MAPSPVLIPSQSVFLAIDLQERLLSNIENASAMVSQIDLVQHVCHLLQVPIIHLVQRPDVLGAFPLVLKNGLAAATLEKKAFSPFNEEEPRRFLESMDAEQWVLSGVESHICVLQTARDLLRRGKHVVVLADACASISIYDYASALSELRHEGARVCSVQTLIFEWLKRSDHPAFKTVLGWIKQTSAGCCQSAEGVQEEKSGCCQGENGASQGCCQA